MPLPPNYNMIKTIKDKALELYQGQHKSIKWKQALRPHICPFYSLIEYVPDNARVLDVGCGSGLFLGLLALTKNIHSGFGYDTSQKAINSANKLNINEKLKQKLHFECRTIKQGIPEGMFSVVSLIDVVHHVHPRHQSEFINNILTKLEDGGIFIYKDMARTPFFYALANRMHDLLLAREWINYFPIDSLKEIAHIHGLKIVHEESIAMYWYKHECLVFKKG